MDKEKLIALVIASVIVAVSIVLLSYISHDKPKMGINYNDSFGANK